MYAMLFTEPSGRIDFVHGSVLPRNDQSLANLQSMQEYLQEENPDVVYTIVKLDMEILS